MKSEWVCMKFMECWKEQRWENGWMPFSVKGQWGPQANTPLRPNINKLFYDRNPNFDLWLLLIILQTLRSKCILYATPGSRPRRAQPYIPHTQSVLWVQASTCGISPHMHRHAQIQHFYKARVQDVIYTVLCCFLDPRGEVGPYVQRCKGRLWVDNEWSLKIYYDGMTHYLRFFSENTKLTISEQNVNVYIRFLL